MIGGCFPRLLIHLTIICIVQLAINVARVKCCTLASDTRRLAPSSIEFRRANEFQPSNVTYFGVVWTEIWGGASREFCEGQGMRSRAVAWLATVTVGVASGTLSRVEVNSGVLSCEDVGSRTRQCISVPFAAPPVGSLRWKPPQPPAAWEGVRDASAAAIKPLCLQVSPASSWPFLFSFHCVHSLLRTHWNARGAGCVSTAGLPLAGHSSMTARGDGLTPAALGLRPFARVVCCDAIILQWHRPT